MFVRFVFWAGLIVSWASIFLLDKKTIKKYTPVGILASLLVTIVYELGYLLGWWKLKKTVASWMKITDFTIAYGPFFVGTIWIFHFTYKKSFWLYTIANITLDALYSFLYVPLFLERTGAAKLLKVKQWGIFGLMQLISFILYPFQKWQDDKDTPQET